MAAEVWKVWDAELGYTPTDFTQLREGQPIPPRDGADPLWGVSRVDEQGNAKLHLFPHITFEWRCAEYGFDPDDIATILDVILHEPWIPNADDPLALTDERAAKILADIHGLPTCWTPGVSDETRRQAHLTRIAAVKSHSARLEPETLTMRQGVIDYLGIDATLPEDPLAPLHQTRLDPIRVEARKLALARYRDRRSSFTPVSITSKPPSTFAGRRPWPAASTGAAE
ncbi:hypothetical protein ACIBG8_07105 [Nonomuraea sp. NPDC050556]|uniref:hypothetical protein n=1 Tax=Nonomuraea sp. NPDC050556 TaxID=3364369 RepID=UPI00378A9BBC